MHVFFKTGEYLLDMLSILGHIQSCVAFTITIVHTLKSSRKIRREIRVMRPSHQKNKTEEVSIPMQNSSSDVHSRKMVRFILIETHNK